MFYDVNGNRQYEMADGVCARASQAFNRYTGKGSRANSMQVAPGAIYYNTWKPQIYHTHTSEVELDYAAYLTRIATWESAYVSSGDWVTLALGNSSGTSSSPKPIKGYRLGPLGRKHFVITSTIHGNEHDGINGEIKAIELLTDRPEFKPFRDEWTIFWIPVMNPDGYANALRNLEKVGPNGKTVNLNRNFDWWWGDFVESASESKGSAPESEPEAKSILDYYRGTGPFAGQGAVVFGFLIDLHANQGPGARYSSRERSWVRISGTPAIPILPGSLMEVDFHLQAKKSFQAIQTQRIINDSTYPDLFVRSLHSRFNPVLHSYLSSQGVPSMIIEEVKVLKAVAGTETYNTACDFRLDYLLAIAAIITASNWTVEDGVLVEPAGTQKIPENPDFSLWSSSEPRPQFWSMSRARLTRQPELEGQWESKARYYDAGEAVKVTSNIVVSLDKVSEFTRIGLTGDPLTSDSACYKFASIDPINDELLAVDLYSSVAIAVKVLATHTNNFGVAVIHGAADNQVHLLGGGTAAPSTGAVTTITKVTSVQLGASAIEANAGDALDTARMFMGYTDNCLDFPASASVRGWLFGGYDGGGSRLTSIETWNPTTEATVTEGGVLPTALADCAAVYNPNDNTVYIFGGTNGSGLSSAIYTFNTGTGVVTTHATSMDVALKHVGAAFTGGDDKIWLIGGELASGAMSDKIYSFKPSTGVFTEEVTILVDADIEGDEDEDGETTPWSILIGRFDMIGVNQGLGDFGEIYFAGGRLTNGAGALQDNIYYFTPEDLVIGLASTIEFGYLRYGSAIEDRSIASFYNEPFDVDIPAAAWSNPDAAWAWDAGQVALGVAATTGWLISLNDATYNSSQRISVDVQFDIAGEPDFKLAVRGTWAAGVLTDGYELVYSNDEIVYTWTLNRVVSSSATELVTDDVSGTSTKHVIASVRNTELRVEKDADSVHIQAIFNGVLLFEYWDLASDRILTADNMGVFGGGG